MEHVPHWSIVYIPDDICGNFEFTYMKAENNGSKIRTVQSMKKYVAFFFL